MKELELYTIDVAALKLKDYFYHYKLGSSFLSLFEDSEESEIKGVDLEVDLKLSKTERMFRLDFEIKGGVELVCDRSNDLFTYPMRCDHLQLLQLGDRYDDSGDELEMVPEGISQINVAHYIYEGIMMSIPMKKLHPRYDQDEVDDEVVYSSDDASEDEGPIDPRWDALNQLKKQ